jgi:hypothetical protein
MRKILVAALIVFALALAIGASAPTTTQAGTCYYTCSCTGTPLYCCVNNGVTTCKLTKAIYCLQIITC